MKKHTRLLSLLLALSLLLTSVFTTTVFASEGDGETTNDSTTEKVVGSYTAPLGSWIPSDGGIKFAVWATEADFLAGNAPVKFSLNNVISEEYVGGRDTEKKTFYVHLFADCEIYQPGSDGKAAQLYTGKNHSVVINLAGFELTVPMGVRIGNSSGVTTTATFTVKNGTFKHTGGQIQTRRQSVLKYDNVVYNYTGGQMVYDEAAKLIEFKDCVVNILSAAGNNFELSVVNDNSFTNELRFINTDVIQTEAPIAPLVRISTSHGADAKLAYRVFFDKDSSVVRPGNMHLIGLNSSNPDRTTAFPVFQVNQEVVFEAGFRMSNNNIIDEYLYTYVNKSSGKALYDQKTVPTAAGYSLLNVSFVDGDQAADVYETVDDDGIITFNKTPDGSLAWTPEGDTSGVDYTGMTFAMWKSEMDYLLGEPPFAFETSTTMLTKVVAASNAQGTSYQNTDLIPGYVRLYADVENKQSRNGQIYIGTNQSLVIDLGGHTLNDKGGFRLTGSAESSLTIKNGTWNLSTYARVMGTGADYSLVFEDLTVKVASNYDFLDAVAADYVRFTDCAVTIENGKAIKLDGTRIDVGTARSTLLLEGTSIAYTTTDPAGSLFVITENVNTDALWDIVIDKESSVSGAASLITLSELYKSGLYTFVALQTVKIENGFLYNGSDAAINVYTFLAYDASTGAAKEAEIKNSDDTLCTITYVASLDEPVDEVDPNPDPAPEGGTTPSPDPGTGTDPTPKPEPEPDPVYPTDKGQYTAPDGAWTPDEAHKGITYGTWASEDDFLAGQPPKTWSTDINLDTTVVGVKDSNGLEYADPTYVPGYVHLFADLENKTAQVVSGHEQKIVINLAGHKIDDTKGFRVGGSSSTHVNASMTIKNGFWNYLSGQIQLRYDVEFIVDNVVFDSSHTQIFYWASADFVTFRNCQFILRKDTHFGLAASYAQYGAPRSTLNFENTEIICVVPITRLFEAATSNYGVTCWDIRFDKDCSIVGKVNELILIDEKFIGGTIYKAQIQNIYFELGFSCTDTSILNGVALYRTTDNMGGEVPNTHIKSSTEVGSIFYSALVLPGTTTPAKGELYAVSDGKITSLVDSIEGKELAYVILVEGARFKIAKIADPDENGATKITCTELQSIPEGATIVFLADLTYDPTGSTAGQGRIHGLNRNIVFDLDGHTFAFDVRLQLEKSFTFMNGKISCENATTIPFYGSAKDETFTFINTDIVFAVAEGSDVYYLFEVVNGDVVMNGGSISAEYRVAFRFINGTENLLSLDGVRIVASYVIDKTYSEGMNLKVNVNNCNVEADCFFRLLGSFASANGDKAEIVIKNSAIIGELVKADAVTAHAITVTVYDTYFSVTPTVPTAAGSLVIPRGQKLMMVEGADLPIAIKTLGAVIKANITLESVFGIQFFIPKDTTITSITIGGVTYNVSELTNTVVYDGVEYLLVTVEDILPSNAAEVIDIVIVYTEGELVNTLASGYSVLDYVKTVLSSDISFYVKEMLVAATEYIAASYQYSAKTNIELDALRQSVTYLANLKENATAEDDDTSMSAVESAFKGAALDLGATNRIRFNLNEAFSGTVSLGGTTYEVVSGKVGELTYIDLELAAYEMYNTVIEVTVGGATGTYSLAKYTYNTMNNDGATDLAKALVSAFYTYTKYANVYYSVVNN